VKVGGLGLIVAGEAVRQAEPAESDGQGTEEATDHLCARFIDGSPHKSRHDEQRRWKQTKKGNRQHPDSNWDLH